MNDGSKCPQAMLLGDDCENSTDPNVRERCRCRSRDDNDDKDLRPRCGYVWWPVAAGAAIGCSCRRSAGSLDQRSVTITSRTTTMAAVAAAVAEAVAAAAAVAAEAAAAEAANPRHCTNIGVSHLRSRFANSKKSSQSKRLPSAWCDAAAFGKERKLMRAWVERCVAEIRLRLPQRQDIDPLFYACAFMLACSLVLGGATRSGFLGDVILALLAIPCSRWASGGYSKWISRGRCDGLYGFASPLLPSPCFNWCHCPRGCGQPCRIEKFQPKASLLFDKMCHGCH